jgi:hypothetical protein
MDCVKMEVEGISHARFGDTGGGSSGFSGFWRHSGYAALWYRDRGWAVIVVTRAYRVGTRTIARWSWRDWAHSWATLVGENESLRVAVPCWRSDDEGCRSCVG